MSVYIGMDAHTRSCVYKVKTTEREVLEANSIPATREALLELARKYPGATLIMEACGVNEWMYDVLSEAGLTVFACHPRNIRRAVGKKTDTTDAAFLVDAYLLGALTPSYVPPRPIRAQRSIARHRAFLSKEKRTVKNRVHAILHRRGIRIADSKSGEDAADIFLVRHREQLLAVPDYELGPLLDIFEYLKKRINATEKTLEREAEKDPGAKLLMSVPGFGPFTAITLVAEIGDVTRFKSADALASYFGLVPRESQSGNTLIRGHITRQGSALVRGMLNQAAWTHIRTCKESTITKGYRRLSKRVGTKKAVVAAQRKLVKVAYWLLKEKREFTLNG